MIGRLITYSEFFNEPIPDEPINLIKHLPKNELIITISKINTLLNPQGALNIDTSVETQIECIKTITDQDPKEKTNFYIPFAYKYLDEFSNNGSLFIRTTCLFAINEILNSKIIENHSKERYVPNERFPIFGYLLTCNQRMLNFTKYDQEKLDEKKIDFFEFQGFLNLPINQYVLYENSLTTFYRAHYLFKKIQNSVVYSTYLNDYLNENFSSSNINELFKFIIISFFKSYDESFKVNYLIVPKSNSFAINFLNNLSKETSLLNLKEKDCSMDFLIVKKNPLYRMGEIRKSNFGYIILDTKFFANKVYSFFVNDFWFDYLKIKTDINRAQWGDFIGKDFFENFVFDIIGASLNSNNYKLLISNELKIAYQHKELVEVADLYISKRQKIFIAQIKSAFLNNIDGFKSVHSIEDFEELNTSNFYKKIGLNQLVENTIKNIHKYKKFLDDPFLNPNEKIQIFPAIIVNENILTIGNINFQIRRKFNEMLKKNSIELDNEFHQILPLLILHIQDLQEIEESISSNEIDLFDLYEKYYEKIEINKTSSNGLFDALTSFSSFIKSIIPQKKLFPSRLRSFKWVEF